MPGGPLRLGLRANDINAYNLAITFNADTYLADDYESNNSASTAKRLSARRHATPDSTTAVLEDPRVTIDATLHSDSDNDWYIVQGVQPSLAEKTRLAAVPTVKVYGNDSQTTLEVFRVNADRSLGPSIGKISSAPCGATRLEVQLDEAPGSWRTSMAAPDATLNNGVRIDLRITPPRFTAALMGDPSGRSHQRFVDLQVPGAGGGSFIGALRSANDGLHLDFLTRPAKRWRNAAAHPGEREFPRRNGRRGLPVRSCPRTINVEPPLLSLSWEARTRHAQRQPDRQRRSDTIWPKQARPNRLASCRRIR